MLRGAAILSSGIVVRGIIVDPRGVEVGPDIPILDSHDFRNGCLGYVESTWAADDTLFGELIFTGRAGRRVYELIERGSLSGVSCRFEIMNFAIRDADGGKVYVEDAIERGPDDPDLIVIAQRTILREVSVTSLPADRNACVRACSPEGVAWQVIHDGERMLDHILRRDRHDVGDEGEDDELMSVSEFLRRRANGLQYYGE
jgi:phage head maturation protease